VDKWDPGLIFWAQGDIHSCRTYGGRTPVSMAAYEENRGSRHVESVRPSGGARLRARCNVLNRS